MANDNMIVIRVSDKLKEELEKLAAEDSRKLSEYIRLQLQKLTGVK